MSQLHLLERLLDGVRNRRWDTIKEQWIKYIPDIKPPGTPPQILLSDVEDFKSFAQKLSVSHNDLYIRLGISGIRSLALWEAIFLLHKAAHVLSAAEMHVKIGVLTWSLSSAYQSCFFSAKSILNFVGINIAEYNNKTIVCDLWPEPDRIEKKFRNQGIISDSDVVLWKTGCVLDHKAIWRIFERTISILRITIWPEEYVKVIKKMDIKDFSRQRNSIHYGNNKWLNEDLFDFVIDDEYATMPLKFVEYFNESVSNKDFTMILSFVIYKMAHLLLKDIASASNKLNDEIKLISSTLQETRHPLYHAQI